MLRWALWRTTRRRLRNSKERSTLSTWSSSSRPSSSSIKALICSTSIISARQASLDILASLHVPFFFTKFSTAELLVPLLRLVPDLRLCPWGLPSDHRHVQHRRREPAQQQQPRLQNPSRTHRCPLLRCLLGHHLRDLLHREAGGLYPVLGSTSWHCAKRKISPQCNPGIIFFCSTWSSMARRKQSLMIGTNCSETSGGNVFEVKHLLASPELRSSYIKTGQNLFCL